MPFPSSIKFTLVQQEHLGSTTHAVWHLLNWFLDLCGAKFLSRGPVLLHMTSKKFHLEQNSFSCRAIFLHKAWTNFHVEIAPHENIISTDNVRCDRDKYNVWIHHPHPHHPLRIISLSSSSSSHPFRCWLSQSAGRGRLFSP